MGKSVTPKYVVVVDGKVHQSMEWKTKEYGAPNAANLQKWVETFGASMNPGGVNAHLKDSSGNIPYPKTAHIQRNERDGVVKATWNAPMFMVW